MAGKTYLILLISLPVVLLKPAENVFVTENEANTILRRWKRANSPFEEFKKGNLERECYEEQCSYEEAREVFENDEKTKQFWSKYIDGDQCSPNPCQYGGSCKDGVGEYTCLCNSGFEGKTCEIVIVKMCSLNNGGCEQYCKVENRDVVCSCTSGYKLGDDGKSCVSSEPYPCGKRTAFRVKRSAPEEKENHKNHTDGSQISIPTKSPADSASLNENVQTDSAPPKENVQTDSAPPKENVQTDSAPPKENVQTDSAPPKENVQTDSAPPKENVQINSTPPKENVQPESVPPSENVQPDAVAASDDVLPELPFYELETNDNPNERIVGGKDCKFGECPWQAVLLSEDNEPFCGGTILSKKFILTAAHCMNQTKYFRVIVGEMNTLKKDGAESIHKVDKIIIHPKFVRLTYDFDIAVVKLKEAINYTDNIIPACLPDPDFAEEVLMNERQAMVSGFGRLHERGAQATKLQKLNVPYVTRQTCKESSKFAITENMFCAGYDKDVKDACQGDSGGPHVTPYKDTYFVTGIVSWGEGCAQQGKYGVYTKVSRLNKWLKGVLKKHQ